MRWGAGLKLSHKLFILLILFSLIPVTIVSYSSQLFNLRAATTYTNSISGQYIRFIANDVNHFLQSLDHSLNPLSIDNDFQKYVAASADQMQEQARLIHQFRPIMQLVLQSNPDVAGILYLDNLGKASFESYQKFMDYNFRFDQDPFYAKLAAIQTPLLSAPHKIPYWLGQPTEAFTFVKPVYQLQSGKITSWLLEEIPVDAIKQILARTKSADHLYLFLYHIPDGAVVSETSITPEITAEFTANLASPNHQNDKEGINESHGGKYQFISQSLIDANWKLVWAAPLDTLTEGARKTRNLTYIIAAAALALSLLIAFPVMRSVLLPLYRLRKGMNQLSLGKFMPIRHHGSDEIGYLIHTYNKMLDDLLLMEKEVYQANLKEKEKELLQLQAQINPHFLFNTLETIDSFAFKSDKASVSQMIQNLSKMMRYNVRGDNGWSTLREEVDYTRRFLHIHSMRNHATSPFELRIDPGLESFPVMKLSIQPFVENALKYGCSPNRISEFKIRLIIEHAARGIRIQIEDNGSGMPVDTLEALREMTRNGGETPVAFMKSHTGIYNIYRRYYLVYGEEWSMELHSEPGSGTKIVIFIPSPRVPLAPPTPI